jgi:hypothetical protein
MSLCRDCPRAQGPSPSCPQDVQAREACQVLVCKAYLLAAGISLDSHPAP